MADSHSGSSSSGTRRCPKCRRRMSKIALRCFHCNWNVPYRQFYLGLIALGVGLLGVVILLGAQRLLARATPESGPVTITKPKPGAK